MGEFLPTFNRLYIFLLSQDEELDGDGDDDDVAQLEGLL